MVHNSPLQVVVSAPGIRIDVLELLGTLTTNALAEALLAACEPRRGTHCNRPEVRQRMLDAWKGAGEGPELGEECNEVRPVAAIKPQPSAPLRPMPCVEDSAEGAREAEVWQAVHRGDVSEVTSLLQSGPRLTHQDSDGATPVIVALMRGRPPAILASLLASRASVHDRTGTDLALPHIWSTQVLLSQDDKDDARAKLDLLVASHADLNARIGLSGDTALHLVARDFESHRERAKTPCGGLFAHRGVIGGRFKMRLLVSAGADLGRWNCDRKTPLDLVCASIRQELQSELSGVASRTH